MNSDTSRDSSISVEHVQEEGPLDNAPPPSSNPGPSPKKNVTFGSEDIRYKTKRTDRTLSTSSLEGNVTPWGRGGNSPSPCSQTFKSPGTTTRSASRTAFNKSQANTKENQRQKNQKAAKQQSEASPVPGKTSWKRKTKTYNKKDPVTESDLEGRLDSFEYRMDNLESNIVECVSQEFSQFFSILSLSKIQCLSISQKNSAFWNMEEKWWLIPLKHVLDSILSPDGSNAKRQHMNWNTNRCQKTSDKTSNQEKFRKENAFWRSNRILISNLFCPLHLTITLPVPVWKL